MSEKTVIAVFVKVGRKGHYYGFKGIFNDVKSFKAWEQTNPPDQGTYYSLREYVLDHPEIHRPPPKGQGRLV